MASTIYQVCSRGIRGSDPMAHLVVRPQDTAALARFYRVSKGVSNHLAQFKSWFILNSPCSGGAHPLVGQVFFPTDGRALDATNDKRVLDALIAYYRYELGNRRRIELEFVGNADPRGAAAYNHKLGLGRASSVQRYVDGRMTAGIGWSFQYRSIVSSLGESATTGNLAGDRRVDILLRSTTCRTYAEGDPFLITAEYTGPLTKSLRFRSWGSFSASLGPVGIDLLEIEVNNPATGGSAFYTYGGGALNWGLPVSFSPPDTGWTEHAIPFGMVDVNDFEGPGSISSISGGAGVSLLIFRGPRVQHCTRVINCRGVEIAMTGLGFQAGVSGGLGYWRRMPYSSEAERREYMRQGKEIVDEQRRRDRIWQRPKL